jgi:BON domain
MKKLALGALVAAGVAYVVTKGRRSGAVTAGARQVFDRVTPPGSNGTGDAAAAAARAADRPDDATLAHKVETEIFRSDDVPKGQINVNAELGVVYLRGEVPEQSMIDDLVRRAQEIDGVNRVESLLHLPGQEAPTEVI